MARGYFQKPCRKAYGEGKQALQRKRRLELAGALSSQILDALDLEAVESTGAIFTRRVDLRKRRNKRFLFLQHLKGRIFTEKVCIAAVRGVIDGLPFQLARDPRSTMDDLVKAQAKRLKLLARKSKRQQPRKKHMEEDETLPYDFWPIQSYCAQVFNLPRKYSTIWVNGHYNQTLLKT